ncbi:MAG: DUF2520 domain-containing protein [Planctomycetes bacterium]|nr:DUF2520 domain-containing protein [Planctomycetota bacterium]
MKDSKIAIIGAGRLGRTIGFILRSAGYAICAVSCRSMENARNAVNFIGEGIPYDDPIKAANGAAIIFITTADNAIAETSGLLAKYGAIKAGAAILHCSGSLNSSALAEMRRIKSFTGSMHPMASFAMPETAVKNLQGVYWCYEGDEEIFPLIEQLVTDMRGIPLKINPDMKVLYHAASVIACNYTIPLTASAVSLLKKSGLNGEQATGALIRLMRSTLDNLSTAPPEKALTGPIARGDIATIEGHLKNLSESAPEHLPLYAFMGLMTLPVAEKGNMINQQQSQKIAHLLTDYLNRRRKRH